MKARPTATGLVLEKLSRLAVTVVAPDLPTGPLEAALATVGEDGFRETLVGIDEDESQLAVQLRWPGQDAGEALFDFHATHFPAHNDRVMPLHSRSARAPLIEWRSRAHMPMGCAIHSVGARPLHRDIALVIDLANRDDIVRDAMTAIAEPLAAITAGHCDGVTDELSPDGVSRWYLRFVLPNDSPRAMAQAMSGIDSIAGALAVSESQRQLFMSLHPLLAGRGPAIASISLSDAGRDQKVGIEYAPASWESALRLMHGVAPGTGAGRRVRALQEITAARALAMIRLEIRNTEPPGVAIWAELTSELSVGRR